MEVASKCDVIYQTRIQRERFADRLDLYKEARGKYIVDTKVMDVLPKHGVILHPLPRLDEVSPNASKMLSRTLDSPLAFLALFIRRLFLCAKASAKPRCHFLHD